MEHVGHPQAVFVRKLGDGVQYAGQFATGNGAVHAVVVRREATHRREGILAPGPEQHALGFVLGLA
ncbi:hypothetical protein D3C76_1693770 [compost metagenome]